MTENEFVEAVEKVSPIVKRYAKNATDSPEDADDIVQSTTLKAWRYIHKFDPTRSSFNTWYINIYQTTLSDHWRGKYERGDTDTSSINDLLEVDHPLYEWDSSAERITLEGSLIELGGIHEKVIRGCFIGGKTFQEVGDELGITHRRIRRIVATGLKRLKHSMKGKTSHGKEADSSTSLE